MPTATDVFLAALARALPAEGTVVVDAGSALGMLAVAFAAATRAPTLRCLLPTGALADLSGWHGPPEDPGWLRGRRGGLGPATVLDLARQGRIVASVLEVEQVDAEGHVGASGRTGSAPASALLLGVAQPLLVAPRHEPSTLVARVEAPRLRDARRPVPLHTPLGVFEVGPSGARLVRRHPMSSTGEISTRTGFSYAVAERLAVTAAPSPDELEVLRHLDPEGRRERLAGVEQPPPAA